MRIITPKMMAMLRDKKRYRVSKSVRLKVSRKRARMKDRDIERKFVLAQKQWREC